MKTNRFLILWASILTGVVLMGAGYQSLMVNPDNGQVKQNVNFMGTALVNYSAIATQSYASAVIPVGMVSTSGNQTIGGTKTFSETITGSISGNAGTVTNGVYTTGAGTVYLAPTGSADGLTSFPTLNQSTTGNAGTVTNGVYTTGSYSDPSWLAISKAKVGLSAVLNAIQLYKDGSDIASIAAGDVLYYNGTTWTRLGKDVGKFLKSGDSPSWDTPAGTTTFTGLTDTFASYSGLGGQYVKVKADASGLETGSPAGNGTVTSVSVTTANGVSGSVATETSTPAITLTLGAITPTSVNALNLMSQAIGFYIQGGTTSKTLTVPLDASVSGTNTGDQTNISGNAATATTLATARAINGVDFNGSQAITIPSNIAPSTSGNVMVSNGTVWTSAAFSALPSGTQGDIIYYNGTAWVVLNAGTSGQFLKTMGAAANPAWGTPAGSGNTTSPGTTTDGYIPQWDGTNSNTLKNGYSAVATATPSTLVLRDINSSITATAFYGDGSHLSNVASTGIEAATPSTIVQRDINASITAEAFYGDGSHLTGISALPSQTGNTGKYLTTDGSSASWGTVSSGGASAPEVHTSDYTVQASDNGKLLSNYGATTDVIFTLPSRETLGSSFEVSFLNEVGVQTKGTGGVVTVDGNYIIHTFTDSGTFVPSEELTAEILVVAGGGGGGGGGEFDKDSGGGGGGGGLIYDDTATITIGSKSIVIGAGGAGGTGRSGTGTNGQNTTFNSLTAIGGGGGGNWSQNGASGGSGGGACGAIGSSYTGGAGTSGQGYAGGNNTTSANYGGGGGGGAGEVGYNGTTTANGAGGTGYQTDISGTSAYYAGGGGHGAGFIGTPSAGGLGGGGGGGGTIGTNGVVNTGGGGGGGTSTGANASSGGAGGSGIVIIKYLATEALSTVTIHPASTDKLPNTISAHSSIKSTAKADYIRLRTASALYDIYADAVYPTAATWVDQLD